MPTILIKNARMVNEGRIDAGDLYLKNGRIEKIGSELTVPADLTMIADGKIVMPGMIDTHVHFREPGLTHKGDIASESRAAVAGGVTSYLEMPNTVPPTTTIARLEEKCRVAARSSVANYGFYLGAARDNLDEIGHLDPKKVAGIKLFLGSSTGNMRVDQPETVNRIFAEAPVLVAVHCEDAAMIAKTEAVFRARFGANVPIEYHPDIRSAEACYRATSFAVDLARRYGTRLHVLHLSTREELSLFSDLPLSEKTITAETGVHYLFFDADDYIEKGTRIKCNPAIKSRGDKKALIQAIKTNKIDTIATDHAPHIRAEKEKPYFDAPSGLPLIQHALVSLLELYHQGAFTLELIAAKTAHAPAELFQIEERGFIREGYWADLVIVDLNRPWTVMAENTLAKCGWSPFDGYRFRSSVVATIVSGHPAWHENRIDASFKGRRLKFDR